MDQSRLHCTQTALEMLCHCVTQHRWTHLLQSTRPQPWLQRGPAHRRSRSATLPTQPAARQSPLCLRCPRAHLPWLPCPRPGLPRARRRLVLLSSRAVSSQLRDRSATSLTYCLSQCYACLISRMPNVLGQIITAWHSMINELDKGTSC